ncbi:MAG TPA: hypothetical protein VKN99_26870 [Polyangia bacterium]|nr:hypothetical protein [Polyangia bacterium]
MTRRHLHRSSAAAIALFTALSTFATPAAHAYTSGRGLNVDPLNGPAAPPYYTGYYYDYGYTGYPGGAVDVGGSSIRFKVNSKPCEDCLGGDFGDAVNAMLRDYTWLVNNGYMGTGMPFVVVLNKESMALERYAFWDYLMYYGYLAYYTMWYLGAYGNPIILEVWNEPDQPDSWIDSWKEWYLLYYAWWYQTNYFPNDRVIVGGLSTGNAGYLNDLRTWGLYAGGVGVHTYSIRQSNSYDLWNYVYGAYVPYAYNYAGQPLPIYMTEWGCADSCGSFCYGYVSDLLNNFFRWGGAIAGGNYWAWSDAQNQRPGSPKFGLFTTIGTTTWAGAAFTGRAWPFSCSQ